MNRKLLQLFELAEEEGIAIEYNNIPATISGLYMKEPGMNPVITIDKSIENDEEKLLIVLAEELGHHFTTIGDFTGFFPRYKERLTLNKSEEKALRWGIEYLLPTYDLMNALKKGISSPDDLFERIDLPSEIIMKRLEFLSRQYEYIKIDEEKRLVLTSYPKISIYKNF